MDYPALERRLRMNSRNSETLVDGFLIDYCDQRDNAIRDLIRGLEPYRNIVDEMPPGWLEYVSSQYIAFRLFRGKGLVRKYRGHDAVRRRSPEELAWLERQLMEPWRFCFCRILYQPYRDFHMMEDVCSGEEFLMYSPALNRWIEEVGGWPALSLVLVNSNDVCRETFGPIANFKGLLPDDLVFFARQLQPHVRYLDDVPAVIDRDPIPFMMLYRWGEIPAAVHKKDFLIAHRADIHNVAPDPARLEEHFVLERRDHVLKCELKRWRKHPHFAECFYDTRKKLLIARAMTERSWHKLASALEYANVDIEFRHVQRGSAMAVMMAEQLFGRNIHMTSYDKLFTEPVDPDMQAELDKLNAFFSGYFEAQNRGVKADVDALARAFDVDPAVARDMIEQIGRNHDLRTR